MNIDAPISSIMTTNVKSVSPDHKLVEVKHIYERKEFHSHIPVVENGDLIGMVSLIDFMRAIHDASLDDTEEVYHELTVRDIMSSYPHTISPETTIRECIERLSKGEYHSMLIASNGKLEGIVTTTDILKQLLVD